MEVDKIIDYGITELRSYPHPRIDVPVRHTRHQVYQHAG
jgi:hypothetical protein